MVRLSCHPSPTLLPLFLLRIFPLPLASSPIICTLLFPLLPLHLLLFIHNTSLSPLPSSLSYSNGSNMSRRIFIYPDTSPAGSFCDYDDPNDVFVGRFLSHLKPHLSLYPYLYIYIYLSIHIHISLYLYLYISISLSSKLHPTLPPNLSAIRQPFPLMTILPSLNHHFPLSFYSKFQ